MPAREKVARGRNYDPVEDLELVRAWVHVSTDASVGINLTAKQLWEKVQKVMESSEPIAAALAAKTLERRTWPSLQAHYGQIQKSIAKYVGCSKQVGSIRQSGSTERDTMMKALALYKERNKNHFAYIECYDVLAKCPKFEQALDKLAERPHSGKRKLSDQEPRLSCGSTTSAASSSSSSTAAEQPSKGVKASKRGKVEQSMPYRTVKAQEKLSKSLSCTVDVLKRQLLVNQAQQRLQEEQALHAMINELFSTKPTSPEHAAYLEKRRAGLLRRLDALSENSSPPPPKPAGVMSPPLQQYEAPPVNDNSTSRPSSNQQHFEASPFNTGSAPPSPSNSSVLSSELSTPSSTANSCPSSPVILDSSTTLFVNVPSSFSPALSSLTTSSFPPLTQPSQTNGPMTGMSVLDF